LARKKAGKQKPESKIMYSLLFFGIIATLNILFIYVVLAATGFNQNSTTAQVYLDILTSLSFPLSVILYLLARGMSAKEMVAQIGLSKSGFNTKSLKYGIMLIGALLLFEFLVSAFSAATGISLPTNVSAVFCGAPLYLLTYAVIGAPISEEILFRGFMVPRLGIIASAVIFAVLHLSYLSVSEFAAAFIFGLLAGYVFRKARSIYPTIFAHMAINGISMVALVLSGGLCLP
jgi:membrane protease YdiL (CAAX protease family)